MFVRCKKRFKDGKEHRYWSVVENVPQPRRPRGAAPRFSIWARSTTASAPPGAARSRCSRGIPGRAPMALFADDREAPELDCEVVRIDVACVVACIEPRQWGACWLSLSLVGSFGAWIGSGAPRLPASRQGTRWLDVLKIQVCYQLIDPGSEWRLHRHWYEHSALRDLLGSERAIADDTLYRCLDKLLAHKQAFFSFLRAQWATLFDARFDVLLYDLTSTYFESDPPHPDKRRFGYSRDKRPDCVQVVIALIVTPEGLPLAYEVMPGNTADQTTMTAFLEKIERQYGRSDRIWIMDRGIPTEETLASMRESDAPVRYLVGTPKGRLTRLETAFLDLPWQEVRQSVDVKLLSEDGELYVLVRSEGRLLKERAMRRRRLKKLWRRLRELQGQSNSRDRLMLKLGAAKKEAGRAWSLVDIRVPETDEELAANGFSVRLRRERLRRTWRRDRRYLLRSNMIAEDPATLWRLYMQLIEIEQAFKELKHDLAIRPIFHRREERIEAHIFVSFIAYCLLVTLKNLARPRAHGLTPRASSKRSPPSRWWTSIYRLPTAGNSSCRVTPGRTRSTSCCCTSSA